ncbi:MAG: hypothetical protein ACBR13_15765 [Microcoleus sp.]
MTTKIIVFDDLPEAGDNLSPIKKEIANSKSMTRNPNLDILTVKTPIVQKKGATIRLK